MLRGSLLGSPAKRKTPIPAFKSSTLRQFDGGWNVIDNELSLTPRFARVLDNFVRGPDGSQSVRFGYGLWKDLKTGQEYASTPLINLGTTNLDRRVIVYWTAHGMSSGHHVDFRNAGFTSINGVHGSDLNNIHTVKVVDANTFTIVVTTAATATGSGVAAVRSVVQDNHILGGDAINGVYFADRIIVVGSTGDVVTINSDLAAAVIWNDAASFALSGNPVGWGQTDFVTFFVFGGKLKILNGVDKPLEVDFANTPPVVFLGDPASGGSNAFVPVGSIGFASNSGYASIAGISGDSSKLQFSANLADGVWVGNPAPDDAVDVDMSKRSQSTDIEITGLGELRDKLVVTFRDSVSIGTLAVTKVVGAATLHDPQFKDSIPQHGSLSHRAIISLGNDVFMCDRVGVPSIGLSSVSGQFIPERVSEFIEPALQANISRLTNETLRKKVWAVFNIAERQYMLFMPRFDPDDERSLRNNPISVLADLGDSKFVVYHQGHNLEVDDEIVITGSSDIDGNAAALFNTTHIISAVIDADNIVIDTGVSFTDVDVTGGGPNVKIQAITQETNCYIYAYNPKLKIRSWSRFRDLDFDWGVRSAYGQIFFGKGGKIYRWGNQQYPYSADQVGDYDYILWSAGTSYSVGDRVYDVVDDTVYIALLAHTSAGASFSAARLADETLWEEYVGEPIKFVWELPWGDFDKRVKVKRIMAVYPDTTGKGQFDLQVYVDELYKDTAGNLTPVRILPFTGGGTGGYGAGPQPYGSGRNTKEQYIWPLPVDCKLWKLRIEGETTDPLRIVAITVLYKEGSMKR